MAKRIEIQVGEVVAAATLLDLEAPIATATLWDLLPIEDRTIPTQWSGSAWRTETDFELVPDGVAEENPAKRLTGGDIIYYPRSHKVGFAYDKAQWLGPYMLERSVSLIGRVDEGLDKFIEICQRIIYEGPKTVRIRRI